MIMEYAEGGELFNYIIEEGHLSENESRNIFQQIIDAIYYLHQMGICHRDLKPENILFDTKDKKRIKIIDFGLSNLYLEENISNNSLSLSNRQDLLDSPCGSPGYAPPEMILGCKYSGIMTDIWSSGIILYAMLCGCLPFDDFSEEKLYSKIIKGSYEYPPHIYISEEAKDFINSILVVNPKQRANIKDIKRNKWFLKNYKPTLGLFNSICEIPVSNLIVKEMKKRGYNEKKIIDSIKNNNHNSLTTIYYLLVKQKLKQGIETESDMISNKFQTLIKEQNKINKKENIKPKCLKLFILNKKKNDYKDKEHKNNKEIKNDKIKEKEYNNKENNNQNKENINKEKNYKLLNKRKNRTISKEKKSNINNIHINNIKNIHYININNIKANILMKTCDNDNNRIKFFKKIVELSKSRKEESNSNSKNKKNEKLNTININKMKEVQFKKYMNLQKKKNTNNLRSKEFKKEKINRFKNNKTILGDSNQINKDFNLSINNNEKKNNSIAIDKNTSKNVIFLSNNVNNINNQDRFIFNKLKKFNKSINLKAQLGLKQLCFNQSKNNEFIKQKNNNIGKILGKQNNILVKKKNNITNNNLKFDSFSKMTHLINNLKISRFGKNKYIMNSISNSQSKSKSRTKDTRTSNSSNSKSKSNSIRHRIKEENFFPFKSSRNNYSKSKSGNKKQIENKFTNLTLEKLSNLKSINCNIQKINQREKKNFLQNKKLDLNKNIINKRINNKETTSSKSKSKSKKKVLSKSKINNNNYYYKLQNFKTSIERHKLQKKIKSKNDMHILINDDNNIIHRHNTNIIENKNINENSINIYSSQKQNQINIVKDNNTNKNLDNVNNKLIQNIILKTNINNEPFNFIQKLKNSDKNMKKKIIMNNYIKQTNNFKNSNINQIKNNIKDKINFHNINNYNKFKEYNKYSTLNNASNSLDEKSQEFYNDFSSLKISSKNKLNKISSNSKFNKSNNNKKSSMKKIKIDNLKPFKLKYLPIYQYIKPQTYRKNNKKFEEFIFSKDSRAKDNNLQLNFTNNSINIGISRK